MSYVPEWFVFAYTSYVEKNSGSSLEEINRHFYAAYPRISQRSIRRYTRALFNNSAHHTLSRPHYTNSDYRTVRLVPERFSRYDEYVERMKGFIARQKPIKLANIQDVHIETCDKSILELVGKVLEDFEPDYVPIMCDVVDNTLFAFNRHGSSYNQLAVEVVQRSEEEEGFSDIALSKIRFERSTLSYLDFLRSVVPSHCIHPVWLGNHEAWLLDYLTKSPEGAGYFLSNFMPKLYERGGLWVDSDVRAELPVTDNVIAIHGWSVRTGNYGSNANNYLRHYGTMSVLAGHSHRMETVWSKPDFNTGGRNFVNITGTLGTIRPEYRRQSYTAHTLGFSLVELAPKGNVGHVVNDIYINVVGDKYVTNWRGKTYESQMQRPQVVNPFAQIG